MKEHIVSYVLADSKWWCGLNILNHGPQATAVHITYYAASGARIREQEINLTAGQATRFLVDVPYGWARIVSEDNVTIMELMGETGKAPMSVPILTRPLA